MLIVHVHVGLVNRDFSSVWLCVDECYEVL